MNSKVEALKYKNTKPKGKPPPVPPDKNQKDNFQVAVKEALKEMIKDTKESYPVSLKVKDLAEIMNISKKTVYTRLEKEEIPGQNKLMGQWRVPRDVFLTWWYGNWYQKKIGGEI